LRRRRLATRRYAAGYMKRHDAGTQQAKHHLDSLRGSGELARILLVRAYCFGGDFTSDSSGYGMTDETRPEGLELWPAAPTWVTAARVADYAWFLNVFIHGLNLLRYLIGATPIVTSVDLSRPNGRLITFDFGAFRRFSIWPRSCRGIGMKASTSCSNGAASASPLPPR
jgi:predicted dehydrogenase